MKEKRQKANERKAIDQRYHKVVKDCPKEVVAIYPPITETSDEQKREVYLKHKKELKEVLDKQM